MPFTPDSSVNSVTHVTLSHEGKEEDYRYTRRQVTRMPLHYTKCLEKRQSNVPVQIGAQQAQTCIWTERNTQDVLYSAYEGEKSLRLCQGSAESSSSTLLQADFQSSFDKSSVTMSTAASSSRTATPIKDVLKKKTFQQSRSFTHKNQTYKWSPFARDPNWIDRVDYISANGGDKSGTFYELKSPSGNIIASSENLLGSEHHGDAQCTLYLDEEAVAMQDASLQPLE